MLLQPPLNLELPRMVNLPSPLYPFQIEGIDFLTRTRPGALLADDMGLGKTVQTIVALRLLFQSGAIDRALVVCRLSNLRQWEYECQRWAPLLRVSVCYGNSFESRERRWKHPAHIYLTTYDTVRADIHAVSAMDKLGHRNDYGVVVLDEISAIKNIAAKRSRAVRSLKRGVAWGLSGTPIENRVEDLYSIFYFLHPTLYGTRPYLSNSQVRERLRPYMLRRRKQDVLDQLPPKVCHDVWIDLTPAQRTAYDIAFHQGVVELREGQELHKVTVQHVLALLGRLKQICNIDPRTRSSAKLDWLDENIEDMTDGDDKLLVFSQYKGSGVAEITARAMKNSGLGPAGVETYTGDLSQSQRQTVLDRFANEPAKKALVLTYGAGAMGLNLQSANYVLLFDHWWNPAIMGQAEDRAHRIGQCKTVMSYRLWVADTVEERIYRILEAKRQLYDEVIDSLAEEGIGGTGLTEKELFSIFGLDPPRHSPPASAPR